MWADLAYCARYGKQPLPVLRAMALGDLHAFKHALCEIVKSENGPKDSE